MFDGSEPIDWDDLTMTSVIDEAKKGSSEAQDKLFGQMQAYLLFVANQHFRASDKAGVSDVVQQSMVNAVERLDGFRGDSFDEFKGWMRRIVINEARQTQRRFAADKRNVRREIHEPTDESNFRFAGGFADSLPTPGTNAIASEQESAILVALQRLPEPYQKVIQLRNWQKLSFGEIGKQMGMSVSGVAKLWYRALAELRKQYEQSDE